MKKIKKVILIVLLLLSHSLLYSIPADPSSILDNIYNYNFRQAADGLKSLDIKDPVIGETLSLEIEWWKAMDREDNNRFSEFLKTLQQFETGAKNELAELISSTYRLRYYACNKKSYLIPFLFIKIQKQIKTIDPERLKVLNDGKLELLIMYKSFLTLIRDRYFIDGFFTVSGRKKELIGNIEGIIRNSISPNRTLGRYFLMKYYMDVEKDKSKAFIYLSELHEQYPQNKIFTQLLTN